MARRSPTLDLGRVITAATAPLPTPGLDPGREAVTDAVLDATSRLLAVRGMRRWSIDDVADRAGLARATVYRRFESRDAMIHAALARDACRWFEALSESVRHLDRLDDQVVAAFVTGLRLARQSPLPPLLRDAWSAAAAGVAPTSGPGGAPLSALMAICRTALADRYEAVTGARLDAATRRRTEAVAEALVRLGLSYLLAPAAGVDLDDDQAARAYFGAVLRPLVGAGAS